MLASLRLYKALKITLLRGLSSAMAFKIPSWILSYTRGTPTSRVGFSSMRSSLKAFKSPW
uniref:Uncharacterized protein n=1 Tax=Arundo donax TaxID=35708 RepID=A0A0A9DQC8_ARUDO